MLAVRIRAMAGGHWLALFALILCAWAALWLMSVPEDLRNVATTFGADFWIGLCTLTPDAAGLAKMGMMWALMAAAMMAPTALPAFATYEELGETGADAPLMPLIAGYLAVWLGFSILAAGLQMILMRADLVSAFGDSRSALLSAGLLSLAGAYQFTPMKEACLSKCRAPMMFFLQYFDEGPWKNGLRLGAVCLGCCWALMLLGFVGGLMNLGFMALATLMMILEKLPQIGAWVTRPLGAALLAGALWTVATGI